MQMFHRMIAHFHSKIKRAERKDNMTHTKKRILILLFIIVVSVVLGRLAFRAFLNFLLGGTMFGGNFL